MKVTVLWSSKDFVREQCFQKTIKITNYTKITLMTANICIESAK